MYYIFGKPSYVRKKEKEMLNSSDSFSEALDGAIEYLDRRLEEIKRKKAEKRNRVYG